MTEYNVKPTEPLTVSFTALNVIMAAHYVHIGLEGEDSVNVEMKPVLGVLIRHCFNKHGELDGSLEEMAVQVDDTGEICAVADYARYCGDGSALIGVYPYKIKEAPTEEEIEAAVNMERRMIVARKCAAEKAAKK